MRTKMTIAELAALMDKFDTKLADQVASQGIDKSAAETIECFNSNKDNGWMLTAEKLSVLGIILLKASQEITGGVNDEFIQDRLETVLNVMLLPCDLWHRIVVEIGNDPGIVTPDRSVRAALERKFGAVGWDRVVGGKTVQPEGNIGEKWTS